MYKLIVVALLSVALTGCITSRGEQIKSVIVAKKNEVHKQLLEDGKSLVCTAPATMVVEEFGSNPSRWQAWQEICLQGRGTSLDLKDK